MKNSILRDKVVVITGATRGIGLELSKTLRTKGALLAVCARGTHNLIDDKYVFAANCDVSDYKQVNSFIQASYKRFGKIDILINNAAVGVFDKIENIETSDWKKIMDINVNGTFYMCHDAIPIIKLNQTTPKGYIMNIGSISHNYVVNQNAAYSASKAATKTFSDHLYNELRLEGILVSYIAVGSVNTSFSKRNPDVIGWKIKPNELSDIIVNTLETGCEYPNLCMSYFEVKTNAPIKTETFKE